MNKWDGWYDSLPKNTQEYLNHQAIWTDMDLAKFVLIAVVTGFLLGLIWAI